MLHNVCTILGQDFEIIVANDGSNEKYSSLVEELTACDSRIKVLNQDNRGVSAALNAGVAIATGQFVMFVDADDEIAAGALREVSMRRARVLQTLRLALPRELIYTTARQRKKARRSPCFPLKRSGC